MGTNECLRVGHSRYIESRLFYSNWKVGANECTATECPKNEQKVQVKVRWATVPQSFRLSSNVCYAFALNHDINSMRPLARSPAQAPRYCGRLDLTTITDYTCANRGDDAYMLRGTYSSLTHRRPYVGIHEMHKSERNVSDANALTQNR